MNDKLITVTAFSPLARTKKLVVAMRIIQTHTSTSESGLGTPVSPLSANLRFSKFVIA